MFILFLAGCVTTSIKTANDVFLQSKIDVDSYQKTSWIQSPSLQFGTGVFLLRAQAANKKIISYQIYVSDISLDWMFFYSACDADGNKLDFRVVDSVVRSYGTTQEDYAIVVDRKYLSNSLDKGINFKAIGKRGEKVIIIPSFYIEGFLKKVDEYITQ